MGAGYDVSASRSEAISQAANQQAGSNINFGSGTTGDAYAGQSAAPTSVAVAARNAGPVQAYGSDSTLAGRSESFHKKVDWPMVAIALVAVCAVAAAIHYHRN
jgi:hypothetical protein